MTLEKLEIHGFRGFKTRQKLTFSIPNGDIGSGLTVITGQNNAGKSSIIECLKARSGHNPPSFHIGFRNISVENVEIKYTINGNEEILRSILHGGSETERVNVTDKHIFVLPSRRAFSPYFGKSQSSRNNYIKNTGLSSQRSTVMPSFEQRLFEIQKNKENLNNFNKLLWEILGFEANWAIDLSEQGQYFLKFFKGEGYHSSDGMGEGIVSVFAIVDALYDSNKGDAIVIDEPELSLHPSLQKRVASKLCEYAIDRQIIISTHSPYFVDIKSIIHGGSLVRVTTGENGTKIFELSQESKELIKKIGTNNLYNPHTFGLDAREVFFQDERIIVTEGQEDVLLFPEIAKQVNLEIKGNFFGWGAGGASNIKHICQILKDLGYAKVIGLLDNDKETEKNDLMKDFPEYHFTCIPAKDIRTKKAIAAKDAVDGLLDKNIKLKSEFVNPIKEMFEEINKQLTT